MSLPWLSDAASRLLVSPSPHLPVSPSSQEGGWALLGLILALAVLGIVLVSSVTPNYRLATQREKELEMLYRGQQMAEGIARYYNIGRLGPVSLSPQPAYGYLKELSKLREGIRLGTNQIKFVRPSATIDPMSSEEWEPVYARDPRIMNYLQAWATETGGILTPQLLALAGPPSATLRVTPPNSNSSSSSSTSGTSTDTGSQTTGTPGRTPSGTPQTRRPNNPNDDDDDDDDDDDKDPFGSIFQNGTNTNLPIVAVAPKAKGPSVRALYGLKTYEEWIFLYIPPPGFNQPNQPNQPNQQDQPRRIGQ